MRYFLYLLILITMLGALREIAIGLIPNRLALSILAPIVEFDSEEYHIVVALDSPEGLVKFTIFSTSDPSVSSEHDQLLVDDGGSIITYPAQAGESLTISGEQFTVDKVRPWTGLLPDPMGEPLMILSLATEEGSWVENQQISPNGDLIVGQTRIQLHPLEKDQTLNLILNQSLEEAPIGRWGILEQNTTLWFDGFTPGEGAQHSDGTSYTLIAFTKTHETPEGIVPAIRVRAEQGDSIRDHIVTTRTSDPQVVLDYPDATYHRLDIAFSILEPPQFILRNIDGTQERGTLKVGRIWKAKSLPLWIRLEQYQTSGVFINAEKSPYLEAVLQSTTRRVRVRQGEAVRIGDALIRYRRVLPEGSIRYTLSLDEAKWTSNEFGSDESVTFMLAGQPCRVDYEDVDMRGGVMVNVIPIFSLFRLILFAGLSITLLILQRAKSSEFLIKD